MIFTPEHAQMILDGPKTQTRRPVKPGEWAMNLEGLFRREGESIKEVYDCSGRLKWYIGQTLAVQPGRGKKAIGRTPPIKEIRREGLQDISMPDIYAEGTLHWPDRQFVEMSAAFIEMWDTLYRKPHRWEDDPWVWVLDWGKEEKDEPG